MVVALRHRVVQEGGRERQRIASVTAWKAILHQADHEDDRELEPLGPVVREDVDGIPILGLHLRGGRIVTGSHQGVDLLDEEGKPIVAQERGLAAHDLEESRHVPDALIARFPGLARQATQPAAGRDEVVEKLARGALRTHGAVPIETAQQTPDDNQGIAREAGGVRAADRLPKRRLQAYAPPGRGVQGARHVLRGEPEDLRGCQVVAADRVLRISDRPKEADQQPNLRLVVEAGRAAETPGDARHVQAAQEGIRVAVAAHQDGVIPGMAAGTNRRRDPVRHRVRLVTAGHEREQLDGTAGTGGRERAPRPQPFVDPLAGLEAFRIVVRDEAMRRVEDLLAAPEIVGQHHASGARVCGPKAQDVRQCRSAEAVDALVVVPDHGDVRAGSAGQEPDEFELGVIRVLELVHQDVPEPSPLHLQDRRMLAQQAQGERDLVAEVEPIRRAHEPLIGGVGRRQLALQSGLLGKRRVLGVRGSRLGTRGRSLEEAGRRDVLVPGPAEEGRQRTKEARRVPQRAVAVQRHLEEVLAQEDHLLGAREDRGAVREPGLERMLPQDPVAECVEGADDRVGVAVGNQPVHAVLHLRGGLLGERQGQNLGWPRALLRDEPGDAAGQHRRLAGSGPGDDQQRPIAMGDRLALAGCEICEQGRLHAKVRACRSRPWCAQLLEDGELVR